MTRLLALIADLAELLHVGYRPQRRRPGGQPFGHYGTTAPLVWPFV